MKEYVRRKCQYGLKKADRVKLEPIDLPSEISNSLFDRCHFNCNDPGFFPWREPLKRELEKYTSAVKEAHILALKSRIPFNSIVEQGGLARRCRCVPRFAIGSRECEKECRNRIGGSQWTGNQFVLCREAAKVKK